MTKITLLALGSNAQGSWGSPAQTLLRVSRWLDANGISVCRASSAYATPPHARSGLMPWFLNQVLVVRTDLPPASLLRLLKRGERAAGRRQRGLWAARPLDIDILSHHGRLINWPAATRAGGPLVLPHSLMHRRGFVLVPLEEVAPRWRHPALGVSASALLARKPSLRRHIRRVSAATVQGQRGSR